MSSNNPGMITPAQHKRLQDTVKRYQRTGCGQTQYAMAQAIVALEDQCRTQQAEYAVLQDQLRAARHE